MAKKRLSGAEIAPLRQRKGLPHIFSEPLFIHINYHHSEIILILLSILFLIFSSSRAIVEIKVSASPMIAFAI